MTVRFIYFDLGRVLLDFTHERGFRQIAYACNGTEEQVRSALMDSGLSDRYETGDVSTSEFHQRFCETSGLTISESQLAHAWGDIFEIKAGTVALAAALRSANIPIGILSNTCEAHWDLASSKFPVLTQLFDPVVTSYEVRSMKPAVAICESAAARVNLEPAELFFVDDRDENVAAARALGWHARLFRSARELANDLESLGLRFAR